VDKKNLATQFSDYESACRYGMEGIDILTRAGFSLEAEVIKVQE
jgi:hypothetical protein